MELSEIFYSNLSDFYLQMKTISDLPWEQLLHGLKTGTFNQERVINSTIAHPVVKLYPPNSRYTKIFLSKLINKLEDEGIEVSEIIYCAYIDILKKSEKNDDFHYRTYTLNSALKVTMRETKNLIVGGTTGLTTWQATHVFVKYFLENISVFESKKVLELGSGLGLAGIALIKSCNLKSYTFTDHHPQVLEFLQENVTLNLPGYKKIDDSPCTVLNWNNTDVRIESLDWESPPTEIKEQDFIIGTDILFDTRLIPCLVSLLVSYAKLQSCKIILAATVRNAETIKCFLDEAERTGLKLVTNEEKHYQESPSLPDCTVRLMTLAWSSMI